MWMVNATKQAHAALAAKWSRVWRTLRSGKLDPHPSAWRVIGISHADYRLRIFTPVLELPFADAGDGWLIFALPPAELATHPAEEHGRHELYLMCDEVHATVAELQGKGVDIARPISDEGFGLMTAIRLPGGGELGLYEPRHPTPLSLDGSTS